MLLAGAQRPGKWLALLSLGCERQTNKTSQGYNSDLCRISRVCCDQSHLGQMGKGRCAMDLIPNVPWKIPQNERFDVSELPQLLERFSTVDYPLFEFQFSSEFFGERNQQSSNFVSTGRCFSGSRYLHRAVKRP